MKYYELNNEAYAYKVEGGVEITTPIFNGVILPQHEALEYDSEGNITNEDVVGLLNKQKAEQLEAELKQAKEKAKSSLTVTTSNGKTFDGNESARLNMQNAIMASEVTGVTETQWKLADNSIVTVDVAEIKEALTLSIMECGRIVMATSIEEL